MDKLEVHSLGTVDIKLNNKTIHEYMSGKAIALLSYLAMNKDKVFNREKLVELFWGSSDYEAAKYNLRYTLWTIRRIFKKDEAQDMIENVKNGCKINENYNIITDVKLLDDLLNKVEQDRDYYENITLEEIHDIYKGEFFEGFYLKNCPEFNDWVFYERESCQRKYFTLLSGFSSYLTEKNLLDKCIDVYEELIKLNPLQEDLYLNLIQLYIDLGDRNAALNQYEKCCKVLRDELDIGPMQELQKVYQQIKHGAQETVPTSINNVKKKNEPFLIVSQQQYTQYIMRKSREKEYILVHELEKSIPELDYYWLVEIMDNISRKIEPDIRNISPIQYMQDLSSINSAFLELISSENNDNSSSITDIRLFKSMEQWLQYVSKHKNIIIAIRHVQFLDDKSFLWLQYFLSRKKGQDIEIIIMDNQSDRIETIKKYNDKYK